MEERIGGPSPRLPSGIPGNYRKKGLRYAEPIPPMPRLPADAGLQERLDTITRTLPISRRHMDTSTLLQVGEARARLGEALHEFTGGTEPVRKYEDRDVVEQTEILRLFQEHAGREIAHGVPWKAFWGSMTQGRSMALRMLGYQPWETADLDDRAEELLTDPTNSVDVWGGAEAATEELGYPERPFAQVGRALRYTPGKSFVQTGITSGVPVVAGVSVGLVASVATANPAVGGAAGFGTAVGLGAALEMSMAGRDALIHFGIDPLDRGAIDAAFADDEMRRKIQTFAVKRGLAIAALDGVGAALGLGMARLAVKATTKTGRAGWTGAGIVTDGVTEGAGEAAAQYWSTGKIDTSEAIMEGVMGAGIGIGVQAGAQGVFGIPKVARRLGNRARARDVTRVATEKEQDAQESAEIVDELKTASTAAKAAGVTEAEEIADAQDQVQTDGSPRRFIHLSASAVAHSGHRELLEKSSPMSTEALTRAYETNGTITIEVAEVITDAELLEAVEELEHDVKWETSGTTVNEARDFAHWAARVRGQLADVRGPNAVELADIAAELRSRALRAGYTEEEAFLAAEAIADNIGALSGLIAQSRQGGLVFGVDTERGQGSPADLFEQFMPLFLPDYDKHRGTKFYQARDDAELEATPALASVVFSRLRDEVQLRLDTFMAEKGPDPQQRLKSSRLAAELNIRMTNVDPQVAAIVNGMIEALGLDGASLLTLNMQNFTQSDLAVVLDPNNSLSDIREHFRSEHAGVGVAERAHQGAVIRPNELDMIAWDPSDSQPSGSASPFRIHPLLHKISAHTTGRTDLNALLHEYGHMQFIMLAELDRLGLLADGPKRALMEMLGVEDLNIYAWEDEKFVKVHEKFAEQFVFWLRDGRAPSQHMRRLYTALALALSRLWRRIRGRFGPDELTVESRLFFEALNWAGRRAGEQKAMNLPKYWTITEAMASGMTREEAIRYFDLVNQQETTYFHRALHGDDGRAPGEAPLEGRINSLEEAARLRAIDEISAVQPEDDQGLVVRMANPAGSERAWDSKRVIFANAAFSQDLEGNPEEGEHSDAPYSSGQNQARQDKLVKDIAAAMQGRSAAVDVTINGNSGGRWVMITGVAEADIPALMISMGISEVASHSGRWVRSGDNVTQSATATGAYFQRRDTAGQEFVVELPNGYKVAPAYSDGYSVPDTKPDAAPVPETPAEGSNLPPQGVGETATPAPELPEDTPPPVPEQPHTVKRRIPREVTPDMEKNVQASLQNQYWAEHLSWMAKKPAKPQVVEMPEGRRPGEDEGPTHEWAHVYDDDGEITDTVWSKIPRQRRRRAVYDTQMAAAKENEKDQAAYELAKKEWLDSRPVGMAGEMKSELDVPAEEKKAGDLAKDLVAKADAAEAARAQGNIKKAEEIEAEIAWYDPNAFMERDGRLGEEIGVESLEEHLEIMAEEARQSEEARQIQEDLMMEDKGWIKDGDGTWIQKAPEEEVALDDEQRAAAKKKLEAETKATQEGELFDPNKGEMDVASRERRARINSEGGIASEGIGPRETPNPVAVAATRILHDTMQAGRVDEMMDTAPQRLRNWDDMADEEGVGFTKGGREKRDTSESEAFFDALQVQFDLIMDLFEVVRVQPDHRNSNVRDALKRNVVQLRGKPIAGKHMKELKRDIPVYGEKRTINGKPVTYEDMLEAVLMVFGAAREGWTWEGAETNIINSYRLMLPIKARYGFENYIGMRFKALGEGAVFEGSPIGPRTAEEPAPPRTIYEMRNQTRSRLNKALPDNNLLSPAVWKVGERLRKTPAAEEQAMFPGLGDAWDGVAVVIASIAKGLDGPVVVGISGDGLMQQKSHELAALKAALAEDGDPVEVVFRPLSADKQHNVVLTLIGEPTPGGLSKWAKESSAALAPNGAVIYLGLGRSPATENKWAKEAIDRFRNRFLSKRGYNRLQNGTPVGAVGESADSVRTLLNWHFEATQTFFESASGLMAFVAGSGSTVRALDANNHFQSLVRKPNDTWVSSVVPPPHGPRHLRMADPGEHSAGRMSHYEARKEAENIIVSDLPDEVDDLNRWARRTEDQGGPVGEERSVAIGKAIHAEEAQKEVGAAERKMRAMSRQNARQMGVDVETHGIIRDILHRHGFWGGEPVDEIGASEHLRARLRARENSAYPLPSSFLPHASSATGVAWRNLRVKEALMLSQLVKAAEHQGNKRRMAQLKETKTDVQVDQMLKEMEGVEGLADKEDLHMLGRWLRTFTDMGTKETLRAMDLLAARFGGKDGVHSAWFRHLFAPIEQAANRVDSRMKKEKDTILANLEKLRESKVFRARNGGMILKNEDGSDGKLITGAMALNIALLWGSSAGRNALAQHTSTITPGDIQQIFSHFTMADWRIVEDIWAHLESFADESDQVAVDLYGVVLKSRGNVEPFYVQALNDDGVMETFPVTGGRYPYMLAKDSGLAGFEDVSDDLLAVTRPDAQRELQEGHAKGKRPLVLDEITYPTAVNRMVRRVEMILPLRDVRLVINRQKIQDEIRRIAGDAGLQLILDWWTTVAQGEQATEGSVEKGLRFIRLNVVAAVLGFSVRTAGQQFLGLPVAMSQIGLGHMLNVMAGSGSPHFNEQTRQFILRKSEMMVNRGDTFDRELIEGAYGQHAKWIDTWHKHGVWGMIRWADTKVSRMVWMAAYNKSMMEDNPIGKDLGDGKVLTSEEADKRAVAYADYMVVQTQGSGSVVHRNKFQRGTEWKRAFFMFATPSVAIQGVLYTLKEMKRRGDIGWAGLIWRGAMATVIIGMLEQLIWGSFDDDDGIEDSLWKGALRGATYPFVGIRELGTALTSIFQPDLPIHIKAGADASLAPFAAMYAMDQFLLGDLEGTEVATQVRRHAFAFGKPIIGKYVPFGQAERTIQAFDKWNKEEYEAYQAMLHTLGMTGLSKIIRNVSTESDFSSDYYGN